MNTNSKIKVTLTRTYEYNTSEIKSKLKDDGYNDNEIDDDLLKHTAKSKALEDFSYSVYLNVISDAIIIDENIYD